MEIESLRPLYAEHLADLGRRYAEVLARAGFDAVVLHSGSLKPRTIFDDQFWPLRATPHFQHWVALAEPDCAMIIRPGSKPQLVWPKVTSVWERPAPPLAEPLFDLLDVVRPESVDAMADLMPKGKVAFIGEDGARAKAWGLDAHQNPDDLVGPLDRLRTHKTAYEIACLAEANLVAARGHEALRKAFLEGHRSELELHLLYLAATEQDDAETPYKNIVALGEHAAVLHHVAYGKRPNARAAESLLVDAGATFLGYCSDITRTWVKGTGATVSAFTGMVEGVESMQRRLCDAVKLETGYEKLHEESHRQVAAILREIGVIKVPTDEAVDKELTRAFYPHGLGHSLGLQCHDVGCALIKPKPDNPYLRNTSTITSQQVFTIEPGIYFIDGLLQKLREGEHGSAIDWQLVDALAPLGGVRIEDDLLVRGADEASAEGHPVRNFTREHLPIGGGLLASS